MTSKMCKCADVKMCRCENAVSLEVFKMVKFSNCFNGNNK